jgi:hypothetical protein
MKMEFREEKIKPKFTLNLSLEETISLWHIINSATKNGNENAKPFVDALYYFAKNSNSYSEHLEN